MISMERAAWKDTQPDLGSKPRLSADLLASIWMTAAGIKPGHVPSHLRHVPMLGVDVSCKSSAIAMLRGDMARNQMLSKQR